jgi:hypothetical protein
MRIELCPACAEGNRIGQELCPNTTGFYIVVSDEGYEIFHGTMRECEAFIARQPR